MLLSVYHGYSRMVILYAALQILGAGAGYGFWVYLGKKTRKTNLSGALKETGHFLWLRRAPYDSWEGRIFLVLFLLLVGFQLYMAFTRASFDGDDAYYVVQALTAQQTDTLYRIDPNRGVSMPLDARHALALFPIFYMITSSFGPAVSTAGNMRTIFPKRWTLDSYVAFFDFSPYSLRWIGNSFITSVSTVLGNVIFASMAGYAFAKIPFKGSKFLFGLILVAMMIPYQVTQVPLYILVVNKFHMSNTYVALILPSIVTSYNVFLAKQFFASIPTPLIESAKLDGCSHPGIFVRIVLPLSKTVLAVMAINTFMSSWNTFFWPFLVTSKDRMYTIQVGLKTFKFANETLFAPMMAGATLSALPMFILFFALQKYFLEGVTIGAVKG